MEKKYFELLQSKFSNKEAIYTELINLEAIQNLPKGTELFLSDIHGSSKIFDHILRTGAGNVREKIANYFGDEWSESKKDQFNLLISYPEFALKDTNFKDQKTAKVYQETIIDLIGFMRFCSVKYTRSKVRKAIPEKYTYIIEELLYTDLNQKEKKLYYSNILDRLVSLNQAEPFIIVVSKIIQRLVIDHLHVVGDVFDRSSGEDEVMERIGSYHSVDIQWGNHDILWMGAMFGSKVNLVTLLRIAARYGYLYELENTYGLNLRPLFLFAEEKYDWHEKFQPIVNEEESIYEHESETLLNKAHQALAIIQFKLEGQLLERRPDFQMENRRVLTQIDQTKQTYSHIGKNYYLNQFPFGSINANDVEALSEEEEYIVSTLLKSFQQSEKLVRSTKFLLKKGSMYLKYNGNLLYHGCIPMDENNEFVELVFEGNTVKGKRLLDTFEDYIRKAAVKPWRDADLATDILWYLWAGKFSPLYGRSQMTTFERYYIKDKASYIEERNPYFEQREKKEIAEKILNEFELYDKQAKIINGHTPIRAKKGENPVKADGRVIVIDGGMNKAYRQSTGIAGYSLLNNSYGFQIVTHSPFHSVQKLFVQGKDGTSLKHVIDKKLERKQIKTTTIGKKIQEQISDLHALIDYLEELGQ
ncbi:fructose-bisphosphatase class III [Lacticigenium naphthae]|uniref:fructose-bisphosphatase class III n=1 Tax=Lacticigenium naphthae TaxID=515351 RepID=UPI00041C7BB2|nr:fructose-bisphosphatase class III [Lacticigenium naphthae]